MILDTNSLSAYADGVPPVVAIVDAADSVELPVVALGEYRFGIAQSRHRSAYERWLSENLLYYRILPIDVDTAVTYAQIRGELKTAGRPIPVNDLWIAALARQHAQPVLSRDRHFDAVSGLRRLAW